MCVCSWCLQLPRNPSVARMSARRRSADEEKHGPLPGHAPELVVAAELEVEPRADHRAVSRAGGEDLSRLGERGHPRGDVQRHPAHVVAADLALTRVESGAQLDAQRLDTLDHCAGAAQRSRRRAVEDDQERVADRLDLLTVEPAEDLADGALLRGEQVAPAGVAETGGMSG